MGMKNHRNHRHKGDSAKKHTDDETVALKLVAV